MSRAPIGSMANLRTLDLSWNELGDTGMIAFADATKPTAESPIGSLRHLASLSLHNNQIGDTGMLAFAEALKPTDNFPMGSLPNLWLLTLWYNTIGDEGMKAFALAIASGSLPSLSDLEVDDGEHPQLKGACQQHRIDLRVRVEPN